jgi:hypothetical protein
MPAYLQSQSTPRTVSDDPASNSRFPVQDRLFKLIVHNGLHCRLGGSESLHLPRSFKKGKTERRAIHCGSPAALSSCEPYQQSGEPSWFGDGMPLGAFAAGPV